MRPRAVSNALFVGALWLLLACAPAARLLIEKGELLAEPSPIGYPSSNPTGNEVVRELRSETVTVLADGYEKDFHYYRVRTDDGAVGYVIDGPGVGPNPLEAERPRP